MKPRRLLLSRTGLAVLLAVGAFFAFTDSKNRSFNSHPMTRFGGPFERMMRVVPSVHDVIWSPFRTPG